MRYRELIENAQDDLQARISIENVALRIIRSIRQGARPYKHPFEGEDAFMFTPDALGVASVMPHVFFVFALQREQIVTGLVSETSLGNYNKFLLVHCLTELTTQSLLDSCKNPELFSTLKHELTHSFDFDRTNNKIAAKKLPSENDKEYNTGYYNDPAEYNAYFHDFSADLSETYREIKQCQDRNEAMDVLHKYGLDGNFKHDLWALRSTGSITVQSFLKWITAKTQKRLLRRLYLLHVEIMKQVNALP